MRAADCSFCQHTNPPGSKFCNVCGAPLYMVPCPHCGAVNEFTASACHQCAGQLQGRAEGAAPPASRVRKSAGGGSGASAAGAPESLPAESLTSEELDPNATLQRLRQLLDPPDSDAATSSPAQGIPDPPVPHRARGSTESDSAGARRYPVSAVTEPAAPRAEPRIAHRGRSVVMIAAAVLGILAASAYSAYRWLADTPAVPAADKAVDAGAPVAKGVVRELGGTPSAAAPVDSTPAAVVTPAVAASTPASTVPPVRPGTVSPGDADRRGTDPPARSPAATTDQRRRGAEARAPSSGVASAAPAAVPRPRTTEAAAGFELQQPRIGPCTEAVATLGLCTREPVQGRE
jgi:hypothetical protein